MDTNPDMTHVYVMYSILGGFVISFGLVSLVVKDRLFLSDALVATILGIIIGPICLNIFNPEALFGKDSLDGVTLELSRVVIGIQVMAAGVSLPGDYLWRERGPLFWLLGPVMIYMWVVTAIGIYLICGTSVLEALTIAACVTPTDPVLCNSIVKGRFAEKRVALSVRLLLSAESGANDGLGYPFLFLPLFLMKYSTAGEAIGQWIARVVLYQIVLSVVVGILVGAVARKALKHATNRQWIDKESFLGFSIALAVFLMGTMSLAGSDDILACFIAGNALTWDQWLNERIEQTFFQEVLDSLFNLSYFVFVGARIPWYMYTMYYDQISYWRMILLALWVLVLRRAPILMAVYKLVPTLKTPMEAFFAGFFGPMGASALFYAMVAKIYLGDTLPILFPIVDFMVLSSVVVHGVSVPFFHLGLQRAETYTSWSRGRRTNYFMPSFEPYVPQFFRPFARFVVGHDHVLTPPGTPFELSRENLNDVEDNPALNKPVGARSIADEVNEEVEILSTATTPPSPTSTLSKKSPLSPRSKRVTHAIDGGASDADTGDLSTLPLSQSDTDRSGAVSLTPHNNQ
ncbi:hypothetical protein SmJEL517_g06074 [Synchytrium microbalum]|uniref:Cation/H+ exchanger transmembrane domain-containing protein n=1 Tax=Synchytrium microbalum TaxID=1806994 RepID=A0A507BYJ1_9FUNG|nr:uncharacterized protein SmJEL517_g06074 [Synchytrium microbalum]TPX30343.1 hypothetical protein SmJEL517_g06074 [Synchytrium microbalum]